MSNLSAILALKLGEAKKTNGCELLDVMFASLRKFSAPGLFRDFFIVAYPGQVELIRDHVRKHEDFSITVLDEQELLPELKNFRDVPGWRVQQLLKLAIAKHVRTPYYLTLDPDVICTHSISEEILLPHGKALLQFEAKEKHHNWWRSAAWQLRFKPLLDQPGMCVTPAILSTDAVKGLIRELSGKSNWVETLLRPHLPGSLSAYWPGFKRRHRWTEYTLYHLYLEKHDLVGVYHALTETPEIPYTLLSKESLWTRGDDEEWENWDVDACFSDVDKSLFFLVQSRKNISPEKIMEKIGSYIA